MRLPLLLTVSILSLQADESAVLRSSLAKFQADPQAALADVEPGSPVERTAMKMILTGGSSTWRTRYLAAEWLLQAHLLRSRMEPVPAVTRERQDLEQAWRLVSTALAQSRRTIVPRGGASFYRGADPVKRSEAAQALSNRVGQEHVPEEFTRTMNTLALEIAVRLEDPSRMAEALEPVLPLTDLRPRDKTFALVAATHCGRWDEARAWCRDLVGTPSFKVLHDRAQEHAASFDYTFLSLDVPASAAWPPAATTPPAVAAELPVAEVRIRLLDVQGDAASAAKIREAYPVGWSAGGPTTPILRRGALARWQVPGAHPPTLTGACGPDRMRLLGYQDLPEGGRRLDTLDLRPDATRSGTWVGTLQSDRPSEAGPVSLRFDVELDLR
ncbi:hypothetical protein GETHLI_17150 [Geothrix limicola]|uniref:Tetratricopeptide repeat protein n=1 Tax=Geothrix limicola TaxID=2927978 RepID=A0ABQ5QFS2_9BACT|nr:hypothetical protein [Geothrix limicola]GLH73213.1 hypothetical protein GETHLI_17150 [Geothrix limicola]